MIILKCNNCGCDFETEFKQRHRKFCSRNCFFDFSKKNKTIGKKKDDTVREERLCVNCGNEFFERKKYDRKICSVECRNEWNSKIENKTLRLDKSKKIISEKYGSVSFFGTEEFKNKKKKFFLDKYGVDSPMKSKLIVDKLKNTIRKKHLIKLIPDLEKNDLLLLDSYTTNKDSNTSKSYNFKCLKCHNIFSSTLLGSGKIPICRKCFPIEKNSQLEQIMKDFMNQNQINFINNNRKILDGLEIDIFLPEFNLGFEINGNYYHSEKNGNKSKNYHLNKVEIAKEKNIKLIQIFEDELLQKKDIVFSRVLNLVGKSKKIFARNCVIKTVDKKTSNTFLETNHIQGGCVDKFRFGLYHKDVLVSIMTFGNKRKVLGNKKVDGEFELIRFCNILDTTVVGGFSKLFNYFIKKYKPNKIETFADIRWSGLIPEKTIYNKVGFNFIKNTSPNYWYINEKKFIHRHHRFKFRKDVLVKEGFDKNKTEWEIMQTKGYDRIWDCGSMKFEYKIN